MQQHQRRATELGKGLDFKPSAAEGAEVAQPGEEEARGDLMSFYSCLKGGWSEVRSVSSPR